MYYLVDGLLVGLALKDELCQSGLLQDTITVYTIANKLRQSLLQFTVGCHEPLCGRIAVVDAEASSAQYVADEALSASYAARDGDVTWR